MTTFSKVKFSERAKYQIVVQGKIWKSHANRLGEMQISVKENPSTGTITILRGFLRDQAELFGLISSVYEMHLSVISIECLGVPISEKTLSN